MPAVSLPALLTPPALYARLAVLAASARPGATGIPRGTPMFGDDVRVALGDLLAEFRAHDSALSDAVAVPAPLSASDQEATMPDVLLRLLELGSLTGMFVMRSHAGLEYATAVHDVLSGTRVVHPRILRYDLPFPGTSRPLDPLDAGDGATPPLCSGDQGRAREVVDCEQSGATPRAQVLV